MTVAPPPLPPEPAPRPAARRLEAFEGATLGAVGAPAAAFGATWTGIGDVRVHTWAFVLIVSTLVGLLAWPVFADASGPPGRRGVGFSALFAALAALLGGTVAAFPFGAVAGLVGGAVGGALAAATWRFAGRLDRATGAVALLLGAGGALGATALWLL